MVFKMSTLTFFAGMIALICLPLYGAIWVFKRQQEQQANDYKKRRQEEKHYYWLNSVGLRDRTLF